MVQVESFPQYSERMQSACCKSILKVLVAMASKGPVLWGFISSVGMFTMNDKLMLMTNMCSLIKIVMRLAYKMQSSVIF